MSLLTRPLTYDDLLPMPKDGKRYEIIGGELHVAAAPSRKHQDALADVFESLRAWVRPRRLGKVYFAPVDVRISPTDIVEPDILFIRQDRLHIVEANTVEGAPDLIVEVLSPSTRDLDLVRKAALYANAGVEEY